MKNKVYLSLGSNIANRAENIFSALSFLESSLLVKIKKASSVCETSPVGEKQRNFYNIAVLAETSLNPFDLLSLVKQAEKILGRKPSRRWGARIIDIDILFYNGEIINFKARAGGLSLTVPHKEICKRLFVLVPMNEIAPNFVHPAADKKISEILKESLLTLQNQKVRIIQKRMENRI